MEKIDTLIFSGAGIKGIYYVGCFKSLLKHKILDIHKIKNIICCSSGCIFGLCILLNYSIDFIELFIKKLDFNNFVNYEDLYDILNGNGFFDNKKIKIFVNSLIYHKYKKNNVTFKELFDLTNSNLMIKVYNYTDQKDEYFNYNSDPNLLVSEAISMSCCIPVFFKAIQYNNKLYLDGGVKDYTPNIIDEKYKNNLTFTVINGKIKTNINENIFTFIGNLYLLSTNKEIIISKNHFLIPCIKNFSITNLQINDIEKEEMIKHSELISDIHILKYL
tara:strand:+ start:3107 stop:3931 length:825 start_codon:yes stop_codon:yes gene_type:complete